MISKTPKFDKAIESLLVDLKPHFKNCVQCKNEFEITENDIKFFKKFKVPEPKMCYDCRRQRRLAFVNYTTLFKRPCDVPNHTEKIISSIPEKTEFSVFDFDYYWHGDRNGNDYGVDFDFSGSFSDQFKKLFLKSPQPALTRNPESINSQYTSYGIQLKNCFYVFGGMKAENVMFSMWPMETKDSLDILVSVNTNLIYEGVYPENCYNCNFVYFSKDCLDCSFIYDCRNCNDCFGCVNLRNKKYCIWNKQYTKEQYFEEISKINLGNRNELKKCKINFSDLVKSLPIKALRNEHSQNISGNYLVNSKNCFNTTWAMYCENLMNVDFVIKLNDCYDCTISANAESLYATSGVGNNCFNVKFSSFGREIRDCEYTMNCKNCQYCFGCIGLVNAKYCVFNKQYTEEGYWKLVDEIKSKMLADGEYGEFFSFSISPFPYNASLSNIIYNISKEEVLNLNGWWYDQNSDLSSEIKIINLNEIENDIKDISDEILNVGIMSESLSKPFRIVKEEFEFYKRKNIAIPSFAPYERIVERFKYLNNFKVFKDKCFKCGLEILSSHATLEGYKPYCDDCYKREIY
ncbi:MAG TPA: hypothetical protein PLO44_01870 [Candidatus Paceibacterota bacterium]|nr:hypothetical protein [Candidatus Paceibacterota bacterium]